MTGSSGKRSKSSGGRGPHAPRVDNEAVVARHAHDRSGRAKGARVAEAAGPAGTERPVHKHHAPDDANARARHRKRRRD